MSLDDYDMPEAIRHQQERNAYAAAAWRQQYERRAQCPDLRDERQQLLGKLNDARMEKARAYVRLAERTRRAIERALQADVNHRRRGRVVPFRERSGR